MMSVTAESSCAPKKQSPSPTPALHAPPSLAGEPAGVTSEQALSAASEELGAGEAAGDTDDDARPLWVGDGVSEAASVALASGLDVAVAAAGLRVACVPVEMMANGVSELSSSSPPQPAHTSRAMKAKAMTASLAIYYPGTCVSSNVDSPLS